MYALRKLLVVAPSAAFFAGCEHIVAPAVQPAPAPAAAAPRAVSPSATGALIEAMGAHGAAQDTRKAAFYLLAHRAGNSGAFTGSNEAASIPGALLIRLDAVRAAPDAPQGFRNAAARITAISRASTPGDAKRPNR